VCESRLLRKYLSVQFNVELLWSLPYTALFDSCYWKTLQTETYLSLLVHYLAVEIDMLFKLH